MGSTLAPLPAESDAESIASEDPQSKSESVEAKDEVLEDAPDVAEDEDEEEGDEEVYVVEKILAHHDNFEDVRFTSPYISQLPKSSRLVEGDALRDQVEGLREEGRSYLGDRRKPRVRSFLPVVIQKNQLIFPPPQRGARDLLEAYWKSIGGKPVPGTKEKPTGKKRGRQSTGTIQPAAKKQKKPGRKSTSALEDPDATPEPPKGYQDVNPDTWKPPPPHDNAWENLVMNVDTIEKDDRGELWAFLVWNEKNEDDRFNRSKAKLATCNKACPQKMLRFYEQHVVFTNSKSNYTGENGA
ncbi:MAG: hypothetical protein Q9204_004548 [Flavoplaca sp. TL-2023a]